MSTAPNTFDPNAEMDLSKEGFQVARTNWTIVKAEVVDKSRDDEPKYTRAQAVVSFKCVIEGRDTEVTMREWLQHPTAKAQQIGLGNLKRLYVSAFGSANGSVPTLLGKMVSAEGWEDKEGWRRIGRFNAPSESASIAQVEMDLPA